MRVRGDDGGIRPWYYIYVYVIESAAELGPARISRVGESASVSPRSQNAAAGSIPYQNEAAAGPILNQNAAAAGSVPNKK